MNALRVHDKLSKKHILADSGMYTILLLGLSSIGGAMSLFMPFGRDQGNYAYAGWAFITGKKLYQEVLAFKPPMTVYVHSLSQILFGHNTESIRIMDWIIITLTAWLIYQLLLKCGLPHHTAFLGSVFYLLQYYGFDYWHSAQTDHWAQLPVILSIILLFTPKPLPYIRIMVCAFLGTAAILFKYTFALIWLPLTLLQLAWNSRSSSERFIQTWLAKCTVLFLGGCLGLMLFLSPVIFQHSIHSYIDIQTNMVAPYATLNIAASPLTLIQQFFTRLYTQPFLLPIGIILLTATITLVPVESSLTRTGNIHSKCLPFTFLWLLGAILACMVQTKFFMYHYAPLLPPVAILGALAFHRIGSSISREQPVRAAWISAATFVSCWLLFWGQGLRNNVQYAWDSWNNNSSEALLARLETLSQRDYSLVDIERLVGYIKDISSHEETVFLWGFDPTVNFMSERFSPSRFIYNYPFRRHPQNPVWVRQLLHDITHSPPSLIIVAKNDQTPGVTCNDEDSLALLQSIPELSALINERYTEEGQIGTHYLVFKQKKETKS